METASFYLQGRLDELPCSSVQSYLTSRRLSGAMMFSQRAGNQMSLKIVHPVIENLADGQLRLRRLSELLHDQELKRYFMAESEMRGQFLSEIRTLLHGDDHDPKLDITIHRTLHRAWGELKSIYGGGDNVLLETAEWGDQETCRAYQKALANKFPTAVQQLLFLQFEHVNRSHDHLKNARTSRAY